MTNVPASYSDEEIIASYIAKAEYWEEQAKSVTPEAVPYVLEYAKHLRTIAECLRMDVLEKNL